MHGSYRDSYALDETGAPYDLAQSPADLVVLSFSDSDLGAFAAGWQRHRAALPTLRLANLVALRHPMSVDMYLESTLAHAKGILIRLIGGEGYWAYGLAQVHALAIRRGIALAVVPGDGRADAALAALSTVTDSTLQRMTAWCEAGGAQAAAATLGELATAAGVMAQPADKPVVGQPHAASLLAVVRPEHGWPEHGWPENGGPGHGGPEYVWPEFGWYDPERGVVDAPPIPPRRAIAVVFYRSYIAAADTEPVDALIAAFRARGFTAYGLFVPSLKAASAAAWISGALATLAPVAIVNVTAFSARNDAGISPLDGPGCPVFQVALSTARRREWAANERGLSPADLAMHVVLPEVDGRLFAGIASFKSPRPRDPDLQFSRFAHRADAGRIGVVVDRVAGWVRLAETPAAAHRIALILSTYPGRPDQSAHAVGLDAVASAEAMLADMAACGYTVPRDPPAIAEMLAGQGKAPSLRWPLTAYRSALQALPPAMQQTLMAAWGEPEDDPAVVDGQFQFPAFQHGAALVALQPERGDSRQREATYHDLTRPPRHSYVAFYLWLAAQRIHAVVHMGAHGTLEWLPGKSVALSETCWPEVLVGALPVIYPFIVNDPGEAAQAKRRLGAVTLGHLPPPQIASAVPPQLVRMERLLDEFSTADGLDPARRLRLIGQIRAEARHTGVAADLGLADAMSVAEMVTRLDRHVCDIKESQFGDGLHVYGTATGERDGLRAALAGARVAPGPAGSPWRGRTDVLPTGRNLTTIDPRAVPSRAAHAQGTTLAAELVRRHLQDHGDWPRALVIDLWGSATMRTAGETFAMALHLAGLAPRWDAGSERVTGFDIVSLADLGRPRVDVTLRVSGLFRDVFPTLAQLFEAGAAALARADEPPADNPYRRAAPRVFGPRPGDYGLGMDGLLEDYTDHGRAALGEAWLTASAWAIDAAGDAHHDRAALEARVHAADAFVHAQDLPETDLLLASDYATHLGGFAAAASRLGAATPVLYHLDASRPDSPRARSLAEELARVVRARAANPAWIDGMRRHGFRGAAEITATLDNLAAFANLTRAVPGHLFDLYYDATLGQPAVHAFMDQHNPAALAALRERFEALHAAGLWITRRNSIVMALDVAAPDAASSDVASKDAVRVTVGATVVGTGEVEHG